MRTTLKPCKSVISESTFFGGGGDAIFVLCKIPPFRKSRKTSDKKVLWKKGKLRPLLDNSKKNLTWRVFQKHVIFRCIWLQIELIFCLKIKYTTVFRLCINPACVYITGHLRYASNRILAKIESEFIPIRLNGKLDPTWHKYIQSNQILSYQD